MFAHARYLRGEGAGGDKDPIEGATPPGDGENKRGLTRRPLSSRVDVPVAASPRSSERSKAATPATVSRSKVVCVAGRGHVTTGCGLVRMLSR